MLYAFDAHLEKNSAIFLGSIYNNPCNKNQQDALFIFKCIPINTVYMFRAGVTAHHQELLFCTYSSWYMSWVYVDWLLEQGIEGNIWA
jgi:hypothetical protein